MDQEQAVGKSPVKKNPSGKRVDSGKRQIIINAYKSKMNSDPTKSLRIIRQELSKELGIGAMTISTTITEYNNTKKVISPCKKRVKTSFRDTFEEFERNVVRRHIHSFWFKREIPTVDKIFQAVSDDDSLPIISRTNHFRLLKEMDFKYSKRSRNSALTEKTEIVCWRRRFLEQLREYRNEGRHLYYLDETWVNAGECTSKTWIDTTVKSPRDAFLQGLSTGAVNPSGKGKRLIVLNIGSEDDFVPGALLCFESKKNTRDYHDEINGETFYEWMEGVLPRLKDNCVIIMDNASYHSVKLDKAPTSQTRKGDIMKWLEDKGEVIDRPMCIPQLFEIVKRIKPQHQKYVIDELAKKNNRNILRLPPYHCELNPIELAWSSVKNYVRMNNKTYKLHDVKNLLIEGVERVDAGMWKNFISHTKKEEDKFWEIDFVIDDVLSAELESVTLTIGDTSSDDSLGTESD
ncbi:uncharacterized protein LOC132933290 [Metopolophium dirhodum]|uniref:uncharacterized protein LOC132933290 n=1 Tax=Metopolophium dirhodum TaxID=44670 RepID=UPI00298F4A52|nr:uncharacterized protein LOC132933290 [Metopolophium dirhodum]